MWASHFKKLTDNACYFNNCRHDLPPKDEYVMSNTNESKQLNYIILLRKSKQNINLIFLFVNVKY